jgi:hypothetical protein
MGVRAMKPSHAVLKAVKSLEVSRQTLDAAVAAVGDGKDADAVVQKFYKEWLNDLLPLIGGPRFRSAVADPDGAFLGWLSSRASSPYHVTYRAVDAVRAQYGDEVAMLFGEVRWNQEVAWASRMRCSDSDRVAFLAEIWLKAARREPAKLFRGLVDCYAEEAVFDPAYSQSAYHMLSADEILDGVADDRHWRPLWLRFAEREFGRFVNATPRAKLVATAASLRESEWRDRVTRANRIQADRLRRWRPSLVLAVLETAVGAGMSSDDLVAAEERFVADVESGRVDLVSTPLPPWQFFMRKLRGPDPYPLTEEEAARRVDAVQSLPPSWVNGFPDDLKAIGAENTRNLLDWYDAVVKDASRTPPLDPAVDYAMFLVENLKDGA